MTERAQSEAKQGRDERAPSGRPGSFGRALSTGFALMSLVPILLAVILLGERVGLTAPALTGRPGLVVALMMASALSGFAFIRRELASTFEKVLRRSEHTAVDEFSKQVREASREEIGKISRAVSGMTQSLETRVRLAVRERDRLRSALARVAETMGTARDADALYGGLVRGVLEAVAARTVYLMRVDEETGDFVTVTAAGESEALAKDTRIPLGDGVPGHAARERRPVRLGRNDERPSGLRGKAESVLAVPMFRGENVLAILIVEDRTDGAPFDDTHLAVVADLANFAAASVGQRDLTEQREREYEGTIRAFARLIEDRDPYARGHSARVASYCEKMARALQLDDDTIRTLRLAALLHDIGKLAIPEALLRKEERYTPEERLQVRKHVVAAERTLSDMPGLAALAPLVQAHHELSDGTGYPRGLKGDEISLATHILIVANSFDVMTSDRSYREAIPLATALDVLRSKAGTWYDRRAVQALLGLDVKVLRGTGDAAEDSGSAVEQGAAAISIRE